MFTIPIFIRFFTFSNQNEILYNQFLFLNKVAFYDIELATEYWIMSYSLRRLLDDESYLQTEKFL